MRKFERKGAKITNRKKIPKKYAKGVPNLQELYGIKRKISVSKIRGKNLQKWWKKKYEKLESQKNAPKMRRKKKTKNVQKKCGENALKMCKNTKNIPPPTLGRPGAVPGANRIFVFCMMWSRNSRRDLMSVFTTTLFSHSNSAHIDRKAVGAQVAGLHNCEVREATHLGRSTRNSPHTKKNNFSVNCSGATFPSEEEPASSCVASRQVVILSVL